VSYEAWVGRALRFREYAGEDLEEREVRLGGFFAQQAAEFLLNAVLIRAAGSRPLSHSISELLSYVAKIFGEVPS
jgi:HEPN domain-containing protein